MFGALTILGAIWGSFVGALCSRWPRGESVVGGRSRCEHCNKTIAGYDLVPLFSYAVLGGKCRACKREIGHRTVVIEAVAAVIGGAAVLLFPGLQSLAVAIFGWLLLPLILLDFEHLWLPDRLTLTLAVGGVAAGPILTPEVTAVDRTIAAVAGFAILQAVRLLYKRARGREGMGAGDPKLFAALGIWLGWQAMPITLLLASALGLTAALALRKTERSAALPFGSYLAAAAFITAWTASA